MSDPVEQPPVETVIQPAEILDPVPAVEIAVESESNSPEIPDSSEEPKKTNKPPTWFGGDGTKKFRPGPRMRLAIAEVVAKVNAGWKPEYILVARKHEVKVNSLQKMMQYYRQGKIELGDPDRELGSKELEVRGEVERTVKLLGRYERLLNDAFEQLVSKAEKEVKDGNPLAWDQLQIPKVIEQLGAMGKLRLSKEKGALEILEQLLKLKTDRQRQIAENAQPKQIEGQTIEIPQPPKLPLTAAAMIHADRARKIQEALGTVEVSEVEDGNGA